MGWNWGPAVQWCLFFSDKTGDFCKFCQAVSHAWYALVLGRSPHFTKEAQRIIEGK